MHSGPKRNKEAGHLVARSSLFEDALRDTSSWSGPRFRSCATSENSTRTTAHTVLTKEAKLDRVPRHQTRKTVRGKVCSVMCSGSSLLNDPVTKILIFRATRPSKIGHEMPTNSAKQNPPASETSSETTTQRFLCWFENNFRIY